VFEVEHFEANKNGSAAGRICSGRTSTNRFFAFGHRKPTAGFASPLRAGSTYAQAPDGQRFLISQLVLDVSPIIILPNASGEKTK
jgi:hypothetical protein